MFLVEKKNRWKNLTVSLNKTNHLFFCEYTVSTKKIEQKKKVFFLSPNRQCPRPDTPMDHFTTY